MKYHSAMQVLYGHKCLLQDDFAYTPSGPLRTTKERCLLQDHMAVYNAVRANVEAYAGQLIGQKYLPRLLKWERHAQSAVLRHHAA